MTDNMLGHKTSLSKLNETEIIPIVFSNYSGMKLEINNKRKTGKVLNTYQYLKYPPLTSLLSFVFL